MKELKFENVKCPPDYYGGRECSAVTENLIAAPIGQWVKISGFESYDAANKCRNNIKSGHRSVGMLLKKKGVKIKTRVNRIEKAVYFCKVTKDPLDSTAFHE